MRHKYGEKVLFYIDLRVYIVQKCKFVVKKLRDCLVVSKLIRTFATAYRAIRVSLARPAPFEPSRTGT